MDTFLKISVLFLLCAALCTIVRKAGQEYALILCVCCVLFAAGAAVSYLSPVIRFLQKLQGISGVNGVIFSPLIKTAAIGFLTQMTAGVCTDAGQQAMAKMTEFCGGLLALYTALPLAEQLLQVLEEMMHG